MNTLQYIIVYSLIGGVVSLIGGLLLLSNKKRAQTLARYATPFAGGALLAAVFLDLLKEGLEVSETYQVLMATLVGILLFFFAENFLHWFHHHHEEADTTDPRKWLIIAGDTLHNGLDGVAIAAAFLISVPTGIVTTIAVAAHEIPQEIGDFGLLLSKGMSRKNVLFANFFSALATTVFAVITYFLGSGEKLSIGMLLGLSAGFLLYIALSDIIPSIHAKQKNSLFDAQSLLLISGVVFVALITNYAHQYIDTEHGSHVEQNCVVSYDKNYELDLSGSCSIDASENAELIIEDDHAE